MPQVEQVGAGEIVQRPPHAPRAAHFGCFERVELRAGVGEECRVAGDGVVAAQLERGGRAGGMVWEKCDGGWRGGEGG